MILLLKTEQNDLRQPCIYILTCKCFYICLKYPFSVNTGFCNASGNVNVTFVDTVCQPMREIFAMYIWTFHTIASQGGSGWIITRCSISVNELKKLQG